MQHEDCSLIDDADFDERARLPTRVLDVRGHVDTDILLVEGNGAHGRYCALSYCWGAPEAYHLRTLHSNLSGHMTSISITSLPQTFRDAVALVRALDIDYLWIDSLCIIQDDEQDWDREAAKMGSLYRNAFLVIAAAGSEDPTGGLFITQSPGNTHLAVPFYHNNVFTGSSFFLGVTSGEDYLPTDGYLRERGWAFQEWYLARRIVFFMPGGMSWKCRTMSFGENSHFGLGLHEHEDWCLLLDNYSRTAFTYPSDRLTAFQGILQARKIEIGGCGAIYGVVDDDTLLIQLLWCRYAKPLIQAGSAIPSWSWAALDGGKSWPTDWQDLVKQIGILERRESGTLHISGPLIRLRLRGMSTQDCCREFLRRSLLTFSKEYESREYCYYWNKCDLAIGRPFENRNDPSTLVGLAVFDIDEETNSSHAYYSLELATNPRSTADPLLVPT
jgi:hypothetical protein